jgi:uncharacterized protein GlcG (DUF336 family)
MLTLDKANKIVEMAIKKAEDLGIAVTVVVVDDHGTPLALARMDGAIKVSPRFALAKAYTSGTIGMATNDMAGYAEEGKPYYGLNSILGGELSTIAGGVPIKDGDKLLGAVGVGGSMDVSQDHDCAQAGVDSLA